MDNLIKTVVEVILLLFVVVEAVCLYHRRSGSAPPASERLKKITRWRMRVRICVAAVLLLIYFWLIKNDSSQLLQTVWLGAYIGFTTNALVTVVLLRVFIPKMKQTIASTITEKILEIVKSKAESTDNTKSINDRNIINKIGRWVNKNKKKLRNCSIKRILKKTSIIIYKIKPTRILKTPARNLTLLSGILLLAFLVYKGGKLVIEKITEDEIKNIENQIKNMSNSEIADSMDEIIGDLLSIIEVLGLVLGGLFALLLSILILH